MLNHEKLELELMKSYCQLFINTSTLLVVFDCILNMIKLEFRQWSKLGIVEFRIERDDDAIPAQQISDPCICLCLKQIKKNCFQKLLKDMDTMRPSLLSCIFCKCQIPVSAFQSKYQEHLQVELAMLVKTPLDSSQQKELLLMLCR